MANTYSQIYLQSVFAVQNRISLIQSLWKDDLYKYITGIAQNNGHKLLAINGTSDHLHIFIGYNTKQLVPNLLQDIKGSSSKWINEKHLVAGKFSWQAGYGTFSYSHSQIDQVIRYINNQEQHHKKQSFQDEYIQLLNKFNIPFDEKFILRDII
jgi:REP element-mobilizing transposase RayT